MSSNYFKRIDQGTQGTTKTGLDQLVDIVDTDFGLAGRISDADIQWGGEFADKMNAVIVEAVNQTGVAREGQFSTDAVRTINAYIRETFQEEWKTLHGDDEKCREETGFHLVQNDGATSYFRGKNLVNTVADGIYHLGFEIQGDRILNEDGNANASLDQLAEWLTVFYIDRSTTQTGLDRMTDMILADKYLAKKTAESDIHQGADAVDRMNEILVEALDQVLAPGDTGVTISHIRAMNTYIRDNYQDEWRGLHGDDEKNGEETGFHLVQNDGAGTRMFKQNFVNTIADGVYHLGFEIQGDHILNEDGDKNASLSDLADWIQYFYMDQSDTETGLDQLVDAVKSDQGLSCRTSAGEINEGALAANQMNHILVDAIKTKDIAVDSRISPDDIRAINAHIRENYFEQWKALHGDDEKNGEETGFHLVQNDGGRIKYKTDKLINTVADGIYHLGFEIQGDRILNEDGDANALVSDLATWLNHFYLGLSIIYGSDKSDRLKGMNQADEIFGGAGNDKIYGCEGDDTADGGSGNDRIYGHAGNDLLFGGDGHDKLIGDQGDDILYGGRGNDRLYGKDGNDRMDGGSGDDYLKGYEGDDIMFGGQGNDKLYGYNDNDVLIAGQGEDRLYGGNGDDILYVLFDNLNDELRGERGADTFYFSSQGSDQGLGNDRIKDFYASKGDRIVIDSPGISVSIEPPSSKSRCYNRSTILLEDSGGGSLGSITVYGEAVSMDNIELLGVGSNPLDIYGFQNDLV